MSHRTSERPSAAPAGAAKPIELAPIAAPDEAPSEPIETRDPPSSRVGFALVGLGRLSLERLVPAFGRSRHCRLAAVVSGDRDKALEVARQNGLADSAVYDYRGFDRIADDPAIEVVYIVLPNSMHAEFTLRAARAGKHVLCEKPMANTVDECRSMIDACRVARRQLMVAYRCQYEPRFQAVRKLVRDRALGRLAELVTTNSQGQGDPTQWRLKRAMAGGGPLPDIGIYCINTARYLSGEEPSAVWAELDRDATDPRFREVETAIRFVMRFPSGLRMTAHSSYDAHKSQFFRLMGRDAWVEMDPGYAYDGNRLRVSRVVDGKETAMEPQFPQVDQFAREMDHMAERARANERTFSPGEEGLQDMRIIAALYASAASGRWVELDPGQAVPRGAPPAST